MRLRCCATFMAALIICVAAQSKPLELSFEVSGLLVRDWFSSSNTVGSSKQFRFTVAVFDDRWQIRNFDDESSSSWERTCDGSNIFHFLKGSTAVGGSSQHDAVVIENVGFIEPGPIPSGGCQTIFVRPGVIETDSYAVTIPWFVYASASVCRMLPCDIPAPWLDARNNPAAGAYRAEVQNSAAHPHLPIAASFILSEDHSMKCGFTQDRPGPMGFNRWLLTEGIPLPVRAAWTRWKPREPFGFVGATYRVTALTNIGSLTIPIEFQLTTFREVSGQISAVYRGTNIVVQQSSKDGVTPSTPITPVHLRDFRFDEKKAKIDYVEYDLGNWAQAANATFLHELLDRRKQSKSHPDLEDDSLLKSRPALVRGFLMATLLVPLLILVFIFKRRHTRL